MSTQINGPINVVRMEGEIDNVKKCIYIFMDLHYPLGQQSECDDVFAKDVNLYLAEKFLELNESDKKFDFFLEIYPIDLRNVSYGFNYQTDINYHEKYILQIRKLFRKIFKYDPKENKVDTSEMFKNVRLHYMDVRYYFTKITKTIVNLLASEQHIMNYNTLENNFLDYIMKSLITLKTSYQIISNILDNLLLNKKKTIIQLNADEPISSKNASQNDANPISSKDASQNDATPNSSKDVSQNDIEYISYILDKMFNKYQNKNVQKIMHQQLDIVKHDLKQLINGCSTTIDMIAEIKNMNLASRNKLVDNPESTNRAGYGHDIRIIRTTIIKLANQLYTIYDHYSDYFTKFMDMFFLRRFLDKKYITNAITYTGAYHSNVYIDILAKDFGFKITHTAYAKYQDLAELNRQVLKTNFGKLGFIFSPPIRTQCSNLENFPKNFP